MSTSQAAVTPSNIPLSPMRVTFNTVDLGGTVDAVAVNVKNEWADILVDQMGKTPLDKVLSGQVYSVKTVLAEVKNKNNWKVAFPFVYQVTSSTGLIYFQQAVGAHLLALAHVLYLHPLENAENNLTNDYKFWKAAVMSAAEVKYGPDKQTGLAVEWIVFPDTDVSPPRFFSYGDPSVGLTDASAGSATPGGGNVGNGTVGTITVNNGVTKTETITVTCVGKATGNNFYVSGSVSGALGEVHVGATSTNTATFTVPSGTPDVVGFVITQGSTQFEVGDTFTIAMTAANYT